MDMTTNFDKQIARLPTNIVDAMTEVFDTLSIAKTAAADIFGADARPEHAIAICQMMTTRIDQTEEGFRSLSRIAR